MFANLLRSLSGTVAEFAKWEPSADRSEVALRNGIEKTLLFVLCASGILGLSSLTLGISQQTTFCDRGLAFWNGFSGASLLVLASACASALFFDTQPVKLAAKLVWTNCESSFFEFGTMAFNTLAVISVCPLALLAWLMRGYVDVTTSPTCRSTAALLYGGTITNITLTISALAFAAVMASYFVATSKRFYDIAILACICDPVGIVVEAAADRMGDVSTIRLPQVPGVRVPSFDELVEMLPSYEKTRSMVKRIVHTVAPTSLPEHVNALLDTRVY